MVAFLSYISNACHSLSGRGGRAAPTYRTGRIYILPRHSKLLYFFARLTRGFFEFSEFSCCQKPVILAIRVALFAWAKSDFAGTAVRKGFLILRVVEKALSILFARLLRVGREKIFK